MTRYSHNKTLPKKRDPGQKYNNLFDLSPDYNVLPVYLRNHNLNFSHTALSRVRVKASLNPNSRLNTSSSFTVVFGSTFSQSEQEVKNSILKQMPTIYFFIVYKFKRQHSTTWIPDERRGNLYLVPSLSWKNDKYPPCIIQV